MGWGARVPQPAAAGQTRPCGTRLLRPLGASAPGSGPHHGKHVAVRTELGPRAILHVEQDARDGAPCHTQHVHAHMPAPHGHPVHAELHAGVAAVVHAPELLVLLQRGALHGALLEFEGSDGCSYCSKVDDVSVLWGQTPVADCTLAWRQWFVHHDCWFCSSVGPFQPGGVWGDKLLACCWPESRKRAPQPGCSPCSCTTAPGQAPCRQHLAAVHGHDTHSHPTAQSHALRHERS